MLDAMLCALLRLEFLLLARRELRSFVCTFVCEVHGAAEKLVCRRALLAAMLQLAASGRNRRVEHAKRTAEHLQRALCRTLMAR